MSPAATAASSWCNLSTGASGHALTSRPVRCHRPLAARLAQTICPRMVAMSADELDEAFRALDGTERYRLRISPGVVGDG